MSSIRAWVLVCLAVPAVVLTFSCSLAIETDPEATGVDLYLGDAGLSRLLTDFEYDVTSLDILLRNGDEELYSFRWYPYSDKSRIFIPIPTAGNFDIDVTHNGVHDGDSVSVTENAKFRIRLGIITIVRIVPGMVGAIDVEPED